MGVAMHRGVRGHPSATCVCQWQTGGNTVPKPQINSVPNASPAAPQSRHFTASLPKMSPLRGQT